MKNTAGQKLGRPLAHVCILSGLCAFLLCLCLSLPVQAFADDWYVQIVPERSHIPLEEAETLGRRMTQWMQDRGFIKREAVETEYSDGKHYAAAPKFTLLLERPELLGWVKNRYKKANELDGVSMELIVDKAVYYPIGGDIENVLCPVCKGSIPEDEGYELISLWWENPEKPLACPLCGVEQDISAYSFTPPWGFSTLCFRFWYIPGLNEAFVKSFAKELGEPVRIVYGGTW